jgi:lipopolysaccharide/colanic/teichoic acid biosynthesis glycosyltransferase
MKLEHALSESLAVRGGSVAAQPGTGEETRLHRGGFAAPGSAWLWRLNLRLRADVLCTWQRWRGATRAAAKRTLDLVVVIPLLVLLAPVLLLTALTILMVDGRPVIISQRRVGRGGRFFQMWKFRTMRKQAEKLESTAAQKHKIAGTGDCFVNPHEESVVKLRRTLMQFSRGGKYPHDPRIMRCGRFIRKFSLDELPQLFQILRGHMSLVGPRPFVTYEVATYSPRDQLRHLVKPGLTGLWQISNRDKLTLDESIGLDLQYIARQSLWLDLKILVLTVPAALGNRGGN